MCTGAEIAAGIGAAIEGIADALGVAAVVGGVTASASQVAALIAACLGDPELASILGTIGTVFGVASGVAGGVAGITGGAVELGITNELASVGESGVEALGGAAAWTADEAQGILHMLAGFGHLGLTFSGQHLAASVFGAGTGFLDLGIAGSMEDVSGLGQLGSALGVGAGIAGTELGLAHDNVAATLLGAGSMFGGLALGRLATPDQATLAQEADEANAVAAAGLAIGAPQRMTPDWLDEEGLASTGDVLSSGVRPTRLSALQLQELGASPGGLLDDPRLLASNDPPLLPFGAAVPKVQVTNGDEGYLLRGDVRADTRLVSDVGLGSSTANATPSMLNVEANDPMYPGLITAYSEPVQTTNGVVLIRMVWIDGAGYVPVGVELPTTASVPGSPSAPAGAGGPPTVAQRQAPSGTTDLQRTMGILRSGPVIAAPDPERGTTSPTSPAPASPEQGAHPSPFSPDPRLSEDTDLTTPAPLAPTRVALGLPGDEAPSAGSWGNRPQLPPDWKPHHNTAPGVDDAWHALGHEREATELGRRAVAWWNDQSPDPFAHGSEHIGTLGRDVTLGLGPARALATALGATASREILPAEAGAAARGEIDTSAKAFNPAEQAIAEHLAGEGRSVTALAESTVDGVRTADALVDGVPTEFKSLDPGASNKTVKAALNSARGQAPNAIIDARGSGLTEAEAQRGLARFVGQKFGRMDTVRILGDGYEVNWSK